MDRMTFFTGESNPRRRVYMGGRSQEVLERDEWLRYLKTERERRKSTREQVSRESDYPCMNLEVQPFLDQMGIERVQRLDQLRNLAASRIQKIFRSRMYIASAKSNIRKQFHQKFGNQCQKPDQNCLSIDSMFLPQLFLFFSVRNNGDISILTEMCRVLLQLVGSGGYPVSIFSGKDYLLKCSAVNARVKKLTVACLTTVCCSRNDLKKHLVMPSDMPVTILLDTITTLIRADNPWTDKVIENLLQHKVFFLLRGFILANTYNIKEHCTQICMSAFENLLDQLTLHTREGHFISETNLKFSFSMQIMSIPFVWRHIPSYKKIFLQNGLAKCYIHELSLCFFRDDVSILPKNKSWELPGLACILSNIVEGFDFPDLSIFTAKEFVLVFTFMLDAIPVLKSAAGEGHNLDTELEVNIKDGMNSYLVQLLVNALLRNSSLIQQSYNAAPSEEDIEVIGTVCCFVHITFCRLPTDLIMIGLARGTDIVVAIWNFIKYCHEKMIWPAFKHLGSYIPDDPQCNLLSLAVFCPVYKCLLSIMNNDNFNELGGPLNLMNIKFLISILKKALYQLLWVIPANGSPQKHVITSFAKTKISLDTIRTIACAAISELITQLHDQNIRRPFTSADDFLLSQIRKNIFLVEVMKKNSNESRLLKLAPFLVPFECRIEIFKKHIKSSLVEHEDFYQHAPFMIRRDNIFEDGYNLLSVLSGESLKGKFIVSFVKGSEIEVGVDAGGIFKEFLEKIILQAFDVKHGLFKETFDHHLYPHPGAAVIDTQQLQYFNFCGRLIGKAMYEGILVEISFATFFLRKIKLKHNELIDLPSLDPELHRNLLSLKDFVGDFRDLELYFALENNEFGEEIEELIPGGKEIRVTKDNFSDYICRVANYRLNLQIQPHISEFLDGFHLLISQEWLDMFSEPEIQLLISGRSESFDIEDLRRNTTYSAGYFPQHPVIRMFWEVLESFSLDHRKKFLKFVTCCSNGPLLGFRELHPKFCISSAVPLHVVQHDLNRLPTAATCFNTLYIPPYKSITQMHSKLLYVIEADAGFHLA